MKKLDAVREAKLALISAPAGFGKSVLAAQWASTVEDVPVSWLTLDEGDNDPARLALHLVAALGGEGDDFHRAARDALVPGAPGLGSPFIDEVVDRLAVRPPLVLVLDDGEALVDGAVRSDLLHLIEVAPPQLHVVALTRREPGAWVHHLRLLDDLVELHARDLELEVDQVHGIVERVAGRTLTEEQARALRERTEGWPAGVQLAAISLREVEDIDAGIASFGVGDRHLVDYLADRVLSGIDPELRSFLLATSMLSRISPELATAVTGRRDSGALLERLESEAMFMSRVGDGSGWYRCHGLFREVLLARARANDPEAGREGTLRAAAWHLERDDLDQALPLLLAAEDWPGAIRAVRSCGRDYVRAGRAATVFGWLSAVPEVVRRRDPMVVIEHAALAIAAGDRPPAESDLAALDRRALSPGQGLLADCLRSTGIDEAGSGGAVLSWIADRLALVQQPDLELPDLFGLFDRRSVEVLLRVCGARVLLFGGQLDEARIELAVVDDQLAGRDDVEPWASDALGSCALLEAWTGRLRTAEERYHQAMRRGAASATLAHHSTSLALLAIAQVFLERGRLARAEIVILEAAASVSRLRRPIITELHTALRCRMALAVGEPERGLGELDALRRQGFGPPRGTVADRLSAVELQLLLAAGEERRARSLLEARRAPPAGPMVGAAAAVLVAAGDHTGAAQVLDDVTIDPADHRTLIERDLWRAVLAARSSRAEGRALLAAAVGRAEADGHVRLFLDAGAPARALLRDLHDREPTPYLRHLLKTDTRPAGTSSASNQALIDPLSERELIVLAYLTTRLTNGEIAEQLFVSVNTLKTHLRHVYAKLGVRDRRAAVAAAEAAGLI